MNDTSSIIIVAKSTIPSEFLENTGDNRIYLIAGKDATIPVTVIPMLQNNKLSVMLIDYETPQILYTIFSYIITGNSNKYELRTNDEKIIKALDIKDNVKFNIDKMLTIGKPAKKTGPRKNVTKKSEKIPDHAVTKPEQTEPKIDPIQETPPVETKPEPENIDEKPPAVKQTRQKHTAKTDMTPAKDLIKQTTGESAGPIVDTILKCIKQATDDESGLEFQLKIHMAAFGYNVSACSKLAKKLKPVFNEIKTMTQN